MTSVSKQLKDYFNNTPQEQLDKDWEELKHWNEIGPEVDEYIKSMIDKYNNLYANDTICRRFLKLGFPFVECQWQNHYDSRQLFHNDKVYYRPLLTTINDWLAFGNLEERTKRDKQLEGKLLNMIKEGLI